MATTTNSIETAILKSGDTTLTAGPPTPFTASVPAGPIHRSTASLSSLSLADLQAATGAFISSQKAFSNWAQTYHARPKAIYAPRSEEEVRLVVELARREGRSVRCFGAGHSPSDLACSQDYMMQLDAVSGVINVDAARQRIEVYAGTRMYDFNALANSHGFAMTLLGSISDQSMAGAIATATHGAGVGFKNLCSSVTSLTIVLADTSIVTVTPDVGRDLFIATLCGLGLTGVIVRVEMELEKTFRLEEEVFSVEWEYFLENYEMIASSAEHVRMFWFPQVKEVKVSRLWRTDKPISPPTDTLTSFKQSLLHKHYNPLNLAIARYFPKILPSHAAFMYRHLHRSAVQDSVKVFNYDCGPPQYTFEGAVPFERTVECLRILGRWLEQEAGNQETDLKVHFPIEIRPVAGDEIWLSPTYKMPATYIGLVQYKPYGLPVSYKSLFATFEKHLYSVGGRPHWAKAHGCSAEQLKRMYERLEDFMKVREAVDPSRVFVNPYVERHLMGLVGEERDMRRFKAKL